MKQLKKKDDHYLFFKVLMSSNSDSQVKSFFLKLGTGKPYFFITRSHLIYMYKIKQWHIKIKIKICMSLKYI